MRKPRNWTILGLFHANVGFDLCAVNPRIVQLCYVSSYQLSVLHTVATFILYVHATIMQHIDRRRMKRKRMDLFLISRALFFVLRCLYNSHMSFHTFSIRQSCVVFESQVPNPLSSLSNVCLTLRFFGTPTSRSSLGQS